MWLDQVLFPGKPIGNTSTTVGIKGALDPLLFAEAVRQSVKETGSLCVHLKVEDDIVYQEGCELSASVVQHIDFAKAGDFAKVGDFSKADDGDAAARRWIEGNSWVPIDRDHFPIFHFALLKLSASTT